MVMNRSSRPLSSLREAAPPAPGHTGRVFGRDSTWTPGTLSAKPACHLPGKTGPRWDRRPHMRWPRRISRRRAASLRKIRPRRSDKPRRMSGRRCTVRGPGGSLHWRLPTELRSGTPDKVSPRQDGGNRTEVKSAARHLTHPAAHTRLDIAVDHFRFIPSDRCAESRCLPDRGRARGSPPSSSRPPAGRAV
jgi:hypothetical protein